MPLVMPTSKTLCLFCSNRFHLSKSPRRLITNDPAQMEEDEVIQEFFELRTAPQLGRVVEPPRWPTRRFWVSPDSPDPNRNQRRKICPRCHMQLPKSVADSEGSSRTIVLLGGREAGKSNYLGVLIYALMERFQDEVGFNLEPLETYNVDDPASGVFSHILWQKRYNDALNLGKRRGTSHRLVPGNQSQSTDKDLRFPLIFRATFGHRHFDLALFDTAGEDIGQGNPVNLDFFYPHIAEAAGLIFLIDPADFPALADLRNPGGKAVPGESLNVVNAVVNFKMASHVPAAFVVTKLDSFRGRIHDGSPILDEARHRGGFDAKTSKLISEEMATYLQRWDGNNLLDNIRIGFRDHAFFALSSFGQQPKNGELERIRPHRVADPLLWLFWKLGYLGACQDGRQPGRTRNT